jgi:hypothetical protein
MRHQRRSTKKATPKGCGPVGSRVKGTAKGKLQLGPLALHSKGARTSNGATRTPLPISDRAGSVTPHATCPQALRRTSDLAGESDRVAGRSFNSASSPLVHTAETLQGYQISVIEQSNPIELVFESNLSINLKVGLL